MSSASTTNPSMGKTLWAQTWPMAIGVMSLLGFNLVDSLFVARLGTQPLAAQSFTFPVSFIVIGLQVGIGIAAAALISRALGRGDEPRACRLGGVVIVGGGVLLALVLMLLWLTSDIIFSLMGAQASLLGEIKAYWGPWLVTSWVGAMLYLGYSLFRAHGRTRFPGLMMVVTSLINLVVDPILIFGWGPIPKLGLVGAAWATLIAFGVGALFVFMRLFKHAWLKWEGLLDELAHSWREFTGIAGPAMISQLMPPLAALVATSIVATEGNAVVAAWGLANRLESFSILVVLALTMSLPPWLGRCYGAGRWSEIRALMILSFKVIVAWQLVLGAVLAVMSPWLSHWMASDEAVSEALNVLMVFMLPSYALLGICMIVVSASNALGWPRRAMMIAFARLFVCYLPCVALGAWLYGTLGIAIGAALGNVLAGIMAGWVFYRGLEQRVQRAEAV
ncbi:MATE family efflux transporter [Larsenimonas salina]|uniref:MATE family efflux transporter n=1 Tax=Larsenimonas salina TaxID=1295565 RepID=UPI003D9A6FDE